MADSFIHSHFCYKASHAEELADAKADRPLRVRVEKVIELTQRQYQYFSTHLLEDMPFIAANRKLAGCDPQGVTHCLLVTTRNDWGGILVDCQGYDYARYAAEVRNKSTLDLRDVPIDHYEPKPRQPHDWQEQR